MSSRTQRRRTYLFIGCFLAVAVSTAYSTVALGSHLRSPAQAAADAAPPRPSLVTAAVEKRNLSERLILRGLVVPGHTVDVKVPAVAVGASSVVTKVVARKGRTVREGSVLLERTGLPMFALALPFPLYRDITAGAHGPDVLEVQRAMRRMGYRTPLNSVFDQATRNLVVRFYKDRGYTADRLSPEVSRPGAGATQGGSGGTPSSGASSPAVETIGQANVLIIDRPGRRISRVLVAQGQILQDPERALFELDGAEPTVKALLAPDQREAVEAGLQATIRDEVAGATVEASVASIGKDAVTWADGQTGYEVRLAFSGAPMAGGANRSVQVDIAVTGGATKVLAVPVTAVYSRVDGSTFVSVVTDGRTHDVTVSLGKTSGGWAEVVQAADETVQAGAEVLVGDHGVTE
jgi:hypothetical protein